MQYHAIPRPLFWPCHVFGATYWAEAPNTETPSGPNTAYLPVPPGFFWRAACRHGHSCTIKYQQVRRGAVRVHTVPYSVVLKRTVL
jgi:hypothetical protein